MPKLWSTFCPRCKSRFSEKWHFPGHSQAGGEKIGFYWWIMEKVTGNKGTESREEKTLKLSQNSLLCEQQGWESRWAGAAPRSCHPHRASKPHKNPHFRGGVRCSDCNHPDCDRTDGSNRHRVFQMRISHRNKGWEAEMKWLHQSHRPDKI